jgi:hypothetical protein
LAPQQTSPSAILLSLTIVDRIRIVQMGFTNEHGGDEFNIANDVHAVQAISIQTAVGDWARVMFVGQACR